MENIKETKTKSEIVSGPIQQLDMANADDGATKIPLDTESYNASKEAGYLTGGKLYVVLFAMSSSYFLILLNSTIVVTVSQPQTNHSPVNTDGKLPGNPKYHE
jgi:hypothetical protein